MLYPAHDFLHLTPVLSCVRRSCGTLDVRGRNGFDGRLSPLAEVCRTQFRLLAAPLNFGILVGMVDDRALRFRRRTPAGEPPNQTRTDSGDNSFLNFLQNANPLALMGSVNSSLVAPAGERAAQGYFPSTFSAEDPGVREAAMDLGLLAAGGAVGKGIQTGARLATLNPGTRQLYLNSILGRLYHGSKTGVPDVLSSRGVQPQNWFGADTFLTTSKPLARTYSREGLYRAKVPFDVAKNMRVMDIYDDPDRLLQIANSPRVSEILGREGANVVRHQSGQAIGAGAPNVGRTIVNPFTGRVTSRQDKAIEKPVYAFLEPGGIQMRRLRDTGGSVRESVGRVAGRTQRTIQDFVDQLLKRGAYDPDNVL